MLGGLKVKLDDITNYIQSICENICTVLDVDVTVVSKDLIRIAGTGVFKDKIYEKISDHSAFSKVLKSQKPYIINRDLEDNCKTCVHKEDCKELVDICSPIMLGSDNLGILGIAAFTEEQKNKILSKDQELCEFINSMSNLISYKLDELYKAEIKTVEQLEKEEIEKAINKYGSNTQEMKQVANQMGKQVLRDCEESVFYQKIPDIWNLAWNNSKYLEFSTIKFHFFLFYYKEKTGKFPMPSPLFSFHPLSARIYPVYA